MMKIDEIDTVILKALLKDARTKLIDLAKDCSITSTSVINRIKRLKECGLIVKEALNINMAAFGYPYFALLGVSLENGKEKEIIEMITKHAIVGGIDTTIGKFDLCIFIFGKSIDDLDELKFRLKEHESVVDVKINISKKHHFHYSNLCIDGD